MQIIKFIIIELCLLVSFSGQQIFESMSSSEIDNSSAVSDISDIINNTTTTAEPSSETSVEPTTEVEETTAPQEDIVTITMPYSTVESHIDFIINQASYLNINTAVDGERVTYSLTEDEQNMLIDHTANYIDTEVPKLTDTENTSLVGIVSSDDYSMLTFVVNRDKFNNEVDTDYIVDIRTIASAKDLPIETNKLQVTIQDSSSNEIFLEYDYIDEYNKE